MSKLVKTFPNLSKFNKTCAKDKLGQTLSKKSKLVVMDCDLSYLLYQRLERDVRPISLDNFIISPDSPDCLDCPNSTDSTDGIDRPVSLDSQGCQD